MQKTTITWLMPLILLLCSCRHEQGSTTRPLDKTFTSCYIELHGQCYDSIDRQVISLDMYSDGLSLDSTNRIKGTGTNLYISDIYMDTCALEAGLYHSSLTTEPFTFLPGQDYEGTPHGVYLLQLQDSRLQHYYVLDSGYVDVQISEDSVYQISMTLYRGKNTYKAQYSGHPFYEDKRD